MQTRSISNKKILEIAISKHCHFIVYRFDENRETKHQKQPSINTHKNPKVADREVRLLLYIFHYIINNNEKLPITAYYIEHKNELDKRFSSIPVSERQLIKDKSGRNVKFHRS